VQIIKKLHDIGAYTEVAFFTEKAVVAVDVSVFISVQQIAPFVANFLSQNEKPFGGCSLPLRGYGVLNFDVFVHV